MSVGVLSSFPCILAHVGTVPRPGLAYGSEGAVQVFPSQNQVRQFTCPRRAPQRFRGSTWATTPTRYDYRPAPLFRWRPDKSIGYITTKAPELPSGLELHISRSALGRECCNRVDHAPAQLRELL